MGNIIMGQLNRRGFIIGVCTYFFIAFFSLILNLPMLYISGNIVSSIATFLSKNIYFMQIEHFVIFSRKVLAEFLVLNMFILLTIEFTIVCLFHGKMNTLFKVKNLFTIKKFLLLSLAIIIVQVAISFWLWNI